MRIHGIAVATTISLTWLCAAPAAHAQALGSRPRVTAQERRNIAVVRGFWREVHQEFHGNAVSKYLAKGYVEHNNGGVNGRERMAQFFGHPSPIVRQMKTISQTVYARGPFVLLHQHRLLPDASHPGKTVNMNMIEMLRVYDGLLQEHWMFFPEGNTPALQPQTEQEYKNIGVVTGFWHDVWEGRNGTAVPEYIASGYIEHGAGAVDGRAAVVRRFGHPMPPDAPKATVVSQTVYARGSFVLLHQHRRVSDPSQPGRNRSVDVIEMFQVYDGLIQQHWTLFPVERGATRAWGEG